MHFCLCSKTIKYTLPLVHKEECTASFLVIVGLPRSQFHVFKLKPNLKPVDFLKINLQCAHITTVWSMQQTVLACWFVADLLSWVCAVLRSYCHSLDYRCASAPWDALYCVFCPTLTKQVAKPASRFVSLNVMAPLSTTFCSAWTKYA